MHHNAKDITGQIFGKLTAIRPTERRSGNSVMWECSCSCGATTYVTSGNLRSRHIKSCGCAKRKDLTGQRFGRLVAIKPTDEKTKAGCVIWLTKCDCGEDHYISSNRLLMGVLSCGCLQKEVASAMKGSLNPSWNPELTDEDRIQGRRIPGYKEWRTATYERDNYTCQKCGKKGGNLNAHHIESYAGNKELRTELSNGVTLCYECHRDLHHIYGHDVGRENLEEWMNEE